MNIRRTAAVIAAVATVAGVATTLTPATSYADDIIGPVTFVGTADCADNAPTTFTVKNRFNKPIEVDVADDQTTFDPGNDHTSTVSANTTATEVFEWYTTVADTQTLTVTVHRPNGNVLRVATRTVPNFWTCYPPEPAGIADYVAYSFTGPETVVQGDTFTRTLVIKNEGNGGGEWPVNATVNGIDGVPWGYSGRYEASVDAPGFDHCSFSPTSSGTLQYVRCFNAYLTPGETATMTVTYKAGRWVGYEYTGGGYVSKTSMELESNTRNNFSGDGLNPYFSQPKTLVIAP